jgi:uncharacterized iron-regulated membrane protein
MEKSTRRTWISIVIASVIIVGILAVAAVGGTAYFFYRHINAQYAPRERRRRAVRRGPGAVLRAEAAHRDAPGG